MNPIAKYELSAHDLPLRCLHSVNKEQTILNRAHTINVLQGKYPHKLNLQVLRLECIIFLIYKTIACIISLNSEVSFFSESISSLFKTFKAGSATMF